MSKSEDFVKKLEEEIISLFPGHHENENTQEKEEPAVKHNDDGEVYEVESENLAVPEIHTGKAVHHTEKKEEEQENDKPSVKYDTLAVPEIHIPHPHNK